MSGPRTWEALWATPDLQYAYDKGIFEGVCVFAGLMGMAEAIRSKTNNDYWKAYYNGYSDAMDEMTEVYEDNPNDWEKWW